ncbi:hypothetical protein BD769DRAFT_1601179 [Suillus cothurnatus]|nr:hypothetical protein BD769DRAFT_1601179 [Suillus cothurnatus]
MVLKRFVWVDYDQEDSPGFNKPFIIKRVPGMKAIFDGIIRGYLSWQSVNNAPPWTIIETVIWSTVNRTCHCLPNILADARDYDEDVKTGVPTIPVLLKSSLKTWMVLTAVQGADMIAFLHNPFIVGNCCFTIALARILGKDSPKVYFRLSLHSQSILIVMYAVMSIFFQTTAVHIGIRSFLENVCQYSLLCALYNTNMQITSITSYDY